MNRKTNPLVFSLYVLHLSFGNDFEPCSNRFAPRRFEAKYLLSSLYQSSCCTVIFRLASIKACIVLQMPALQCLRRDPSISKKRGWPWGGTLILLPVDYKSRFWRVLILKNVQMALPPSTHLSIRWFALNMMSYFMCILWFVYLFRDVLFYILLVSGSTESLLSSLSFATSY